MLYNIMLYIIIICLYVVVNNTIHIYTSVSLLFLVEP